MRNHKPSSTFLIRYSLFFIPLLVLAFTTGDTKSEYILPLRAHSIRSTDLDLDGDIDIVVGHQYSSQSNWGGLSIMDNNGQGYLQLVDSFYVDYGFPFVHVDTIDNNAIPDIFSIHITTNPYTVYAGIIYNYAETQFDSTKSFVINYDEMVDYITSGDVDGDGFMDIVFACNTDKFWGIIYNDGSGNFSEPLFYDVDYYPTDLKCGDLNEDGKDDIVIASAQVEIYYSTDDGFIYNPVGDGEDQVALADFDKDNDMDIVGNAGFGVTSITFYENTGNGNFIIHEIPSFQPNLGNLNQADLNNDSLPDVIMENISFLYIFYNQSNFTLSESSIIALDNSSSYHNFDFRDLDGNGLQDIAYTLLLNNYLPNLRILFNDGEGNFVEDPITDIENPKSINQNSILCYPNPFTNTTQICYELEKKAPVQIRIFDHTGKQIKSFDQGTMDKGSHGVEFSVDGLTSGIYLYSFEVNGQVSALKKMMVVK